MKGKNYPTTFLPLNTKIVGPVTYIKDKETICLTKDQTRHIYKMVELEGVVNIEIIKQEIEENKLSKNNIDGEEEVNPYNNIIINNIDRENVISSQMEQWLILSNVGNYVQYDRNPKNFYDLVVIVIDKKNHKKINDRLRDEDRQVLELGSGNNPDKLQGEYLDTYEEVASEVLSTPDFDENSDLSMTYLGRIDMTRASKIRVEEKSPITEQRYMVGKLLDGMESQIYNIKYLKHIKMNLYSTLINRLCLC